MKVVFKILALILLGLTITGCELFDPREWQRLKREYFLTGRDYDRPTGKTSIERPHCLVDENGNKKECRKTPYENKRFTGCSGSNTGMLGTGRICTYEDY
ncbi:hypothetical protein AB8B23_11825 [Leptotrichia sp. HSP-342]|uniref:Lipoprotein n=1 Tax=Leptotrichia mesophila TaxID=3239303 RepID=A0AB39V9T4_9FUSO